MFVIPCKYSPVHNYIVPLVQQIRKWHPTEPIVVVDSDSDDKSYMAALAEYDVRIEDVANHYWMVGAYWHAFKKWPDEPFYYFLHDSMIVKGNMDYLKDNELTVFACFERNVLQEFGCMSKPIEEHTCFRWTKNGYGCAGPIFFCQNQVMRFLREHGCDRVLPTNKLETGGCEAAFGLFFEGLGYKIGPDDGHNLHGNILFEESPKGRSGPPPHDTSWQYPIEKFYASHRGKAGDGRNKNAGFDFSGH